MREDQAAQGDPGMNSLDEMAVQKLAVLDKRHLRRRLSLGDRRDGVVVERAGRRLISFCCNDYLNLSQDERVRAASIAAIREYGAGAGASRLVTGNHPLLPELERRLAALKGTEDAVVFGSGYLANLGIVPALMSSRDLIVADELAHACLHAGARMSGARTLFFKHNDVDDLARLLAQHRAADPHRLAHCLVLTEGVFSMDGDLAPLPALSRLCEEHDAWLMVDDAHGLGTLGEGRGAAFAFPSADLRIPLQMGTLSKAVGSYGGYVCTSHAVAELLRNRARTLIYTTGLPPAAVAAASAALEILAADAGLCALPLARAARFCALVGLPPPQSCIVPLLLGDARRALEASRSLEEEGFLVTAIRPPTVPRGTARLRFTFTAQHTVEDVQNLADALHRHGYAPAGIA